MFDFESIVQANDIQDTLRLLDADPKAQVIAGGSDVLVQVREGKRAGKRFVSIHGIETLSGVFMESDGTIVILPLTTFAEVTESPIIKQHIPTLGYATDQAGGPQLRNIGTIGGNICNGATSADSAPTLLTLNAQLEITGPIGVRFTPLENFYIGPGKVKLESNELLTAIRIAKKDYEGYVGCYIKFSQRKAMDIATLGCAVHIKTEGATDITVQDLRLAFGVAAPTPMRCHDTENSVVGMMITSDFFRKVSECAATEVKPRDSWRASKAFRLQLVRELSQRALRKAILDAEGVID